MEMFTTTGKPGQTAGEPLDSKNPGQVKPSLCARTLTIHRRTNRTGCVLTDAVLGGRATNPKKPKSCGETLSAQYVG